MGVIEKANVSKAQIIYRTAPDQKTHIGSSDNAETSFQWMTIKRKKVSECLFRNILVATAVLLGVTIIRVASDQPNAQSVFQAIKSSVTIDFDETLGKLSFVSNILPETALVFWNNNAADTILAPAQGDIIHAWHANEPFISIKGLIRDVRVAADGEVMAISHGNGEEVIIRVRHPNDLETLYGNLQTCFVEEGSMISRGDLLGETGPGSEVFFELRKDGRAIDPTYYMTQEMDED